MPVTLNTLLHTFTHTYREKSIFKSIQGINNIQTCLIVELHVIKIIGNDKLIVSLYNHVQLYFPVKCIIYYY